MCLTLSDANPINPFLTYLDHPATEWLGCRAGYTASCRIRLSVTTLVSKAGRVEAVMIDEPLDYVLHKGECIAASEAA